MDTPTPANVSQELLPEEEYVAEFRGNYQEYFKIWIVNLMLSVVTLGIYSAWAKVRSRRYFLGNTFLAGSSFEFHGDPLKILKGRILMGALFVGYAFGGKISPWITGISVLIFLLAFPWIVVKGLMFNLANTSYRNIRFGFKARIRDSYWVYFKAFLFMIFTLGIGSPSAFHRHANFKLNHSRFGRTRFKFTGTSGKFYEAYWVGAGIYIVGAIIGLVISFVLGIIFGKDSVLVGVVPVICIYGSMFFAVAFGKSTIHNYIAECTRLGSIHFRAKMLTEDMAILYFTNLLAIIFTLGLATPWALVRSYKYRLSVTKVRAPAGTLEKFKANEAQSPEAYGDAAMDFWDIDLGF